ncbi:MAG: hypothetical protein GY737_19000 [Desulfobacteraceae bacterium]|nr:hypothetical protein [Desulfobacteraceae bacterium]
MKQRLKSLLICCIAIIIPFLWMETGHTAIVILEDSSEYTIIAGDAPQIYGTEGTNLVTLESGAVATFLNFPGNNILTIKSDSSLFTVSRSGAYVTFTGTDSTVLKIPATLDSQTIIFDNETFSLNINSNRVMLGNQEINLTPVEISASGGIKSLSVGAEHTAFVKADGSLWAFGKNSTGQIGVGNIVDQSSPINIGSNYKVVSAGTNHTLAIDDSGSLWAWGSFQFGQLGNGMDILDIRRYDPSYITSPTPIDAGSKYIAISAGEYYSLGIKDDNSLWAWGCGMSSKLGNDSVENHKLPVKIGDNFKAVAAGEYHTLAIKTDGSLWAWGRNLYGEVGHGGSFGYYFGQDTPVQISAPGDRFKAIAAGGYNSLAIKEDGSLWTWGQTEDGQLGLGEDADNPGYPASSNQNSPVKIPISGNFVSIDIGSWHSVALQDNGDIWSWGHNSRGELGVEASAGENALGYPILTDRFSPTLMGHDYIAIGAGTFNTVAIKKDVSVDSCGKISLEGEEAVYKYFLTYGIFK